jgi:hypothetical protein
LPLGLDGEQVVGLLAGHQELGRVGVGVQRVGSHHHAGKIQVGQQGLEGGHLTWGAVDLALGEHRAGGVLHRSDQVDLPAVAAGAAQLFPSTAVCPRPTRQSRRPTAHQPGPQQRRAPGWRPAGGDAQRGP